MEVNTSMMKQGAADYSACEAELLFLNWIFLPVKRFATREQSPGPSMESVLLFSVIFQGNQSRRLCRPW
eukprot:scaffold259857_cov18-Prasinocladus_malaysianus.AAC.1